MHKKQLQTHLKYCNYSKVNQKIHACPNNCGRRSWDLTQFQFIWVQFARSQKQNANPKYFNAYIVAKWLGPKKRLNNTLLTVTKQSGLLVCVEKISTINEVWTDTKQYARNLKNNNSIPHTHRPLFLSFLFISLWNTFD